MRRQRGRYVDGTAARMRDHNSPSQKMQPLLQAARQNTVTLLYSSHDTEHNNAVVLRDYLNEWLAQR